MLRSSLRLIPRAPCLLRASAIARPALAKRIPVFPAKIRPYSISTSGENVSRIIDDISDNEYAKLSNVYLESLCDELEQLSEDYPQVDAELNHGVMTLSVAPGKTYVINKQPPNKQIWLSSPVSGPKRYDLIGGKWTTLRDGSELTVLLDKELSDELGTEVSLNVEE
ncbi:hypothetical protein FT663_03673 [Candidozyma haemuli var. vulneris]|uniref:ferroxidase n=1 Tax=Candidozyma haemuli TaxID=45357 RepID=A0A2V1AS69_9ASCO|nr:iron donor protein CyaY [[Candida] haemuloni]KAF3987782.1 hypothetical protein FT662_03800 [[Candida] haemuloni var. vulneris]KAF3989251.1 hypothetical protein FT663_03673 [[Candida] haemuloni var. vulneris]PVH20940.1 iron donor protein CyaY [[Candida] haemuloni]